MGRSEFGHAIVCNSRWLIVALKLADWLFLLNGTALCGLFAVMSI
jgi:hypothetical protein